MTQLDPTSVAPAASTAARLALPVWKKALLALSGVFMTAGGALTVVASGEEPPAPTGPGSSTAVSEAPAARNGELHGQAAGAEAGALASPGVHPGPVTVQGTSLPLTAPPVHGLAPGRDTALGGQELTGPATTELPSTQRSTAATGTFLAEPPPASGLAPPPSGAPTDGLPWNTFLLKGGISLFLGFCIGALVRAFLRTSVVLVGAAALGLLGLSHLGVLAVDWASLQSQGLALAERLQGEFTSLRAFVAGNLPSGGMAGLGLFAGVKKG